MNKRFIALLLAFSLLLLTVACGSNEFVSYQNTKATDEIDFKEEPVTITYLTIGNKPTNGRTEEVVERLNKILLKKANAKLDIYYIGWNDYLDNYDKALKDESLSIDLIGTGTDWLDAWPNVIEGNFLPLSEDMLSKYCSVTYSNVNARQWNECSYNGNIYFIPENEYTQWTNHGFVYRKDIAKEAGLSEVASFDDLNTYFECVKKNHPGMIPWDYAGDSVITTLGYLTSSMKYAPIYEVTTYGIWGEDLDNKGTIISPYYEGEELIDYAKLMKRWNVIGVWRNDPSTAGDNTAEFYSGTTSVVQHHTQNFYTNIKPNMQVSMPDVDTAFFWFGKESGNLMRNSILHGAMAVSARSENPERALMVYDILRNDEECYRLIRYGIKGVQYNITDTGMLERPNGYNDEKDSMITDWWWGRRDEFEIPDAGYSWDDYYSLVNSYEHVAIEYPWEGVPFSTPEINSDLEDIVAIFDKYIPQLSTGQYVGSPEAKVAEFRQELKLAGFESITGRLQRIYNAR